MDQILDIPFAAMSPIARLDDGVLVGGLHDRDGKFVEFAKHVRWGDDILHTGGTAEIPRNDNPPVSPAGLYGGIFFNHFGHFLTESLGRLWAVNDAGLKHLPIYVHALWGKINLENSDGYHAISLVSLGIDLQRIVFIEDHLTIERLYVPKLQFWFRRYGLMNRRFLRFLANSERYIVATMRDSASLPKKIYVSRTRWDRARGVVVGEPDFEAFLRENGYTPIYPESLTLRDQLAHYAAADAVIFAEGSALHGCMLLPGLRAKVAVIRRRAGGPSVDQCYLIGFTQLVVHISEVEKHLYFGMKDWSGVAYVDYEKVSQSLVDLGFLESTFTNWSFVRDEAEKLALSQFGAAAASYQQFDRQAYSSFMSTIQPSQQLDTNFDHG